VLDPVLLAALCHGPILSRGGLPSTLEGVQHGLVDVDVLAERVRALVARAPAGTHRTLVGITGPPGAGKSTVAAELVEALRHGGPQAVLIPMDGFHLAQAQLDALGLADVKGAPQTFDGWGYQAVLERLRRNGSTVVYAPEFRREIEEPVAGAIAVRPDVAVVVTEGNYLLLDDEPWAGVRRLLDEVWYLDVDVELRRQRLAARHRHFGRSDAESWQRTLGSDEANAVLVQQSIARADLVVPLG
jgi:pantothenate kinase